MEKIENEILDGLYSAVKSYDEQAAIKFAKKAIENGVDALRAIEEGLTRGIREVGEKFDRGEIFLPHIVTAADTMKKAVEILEPHLKKGIERKLKGKVVLGTVKGDIHDIGKSIVKSMLDASGFQTFDLGCDVPASKFIEKAKEVDADIIAMSALLTSSMHVQRDVIQELEKQDIRNKFKVLVGGGSVTEEWAKTIGADGYAEDAIQAVRISEKILSEG